MVVAAVLASMPCGGAADDVADDPAGVTPLPAEAAEDPPGDPRDGDLVIDPPAPGNDAPRVRVPPQVNMAGFTREYHPLPIDATEADVAIRAALDRRIEGAWDFDDASLRDVVRRLRECLGVTVVLDERALEDAGIDPDEGTVTARLSGMTARAALRAVLAPFDVACVAADEGLTITNLEEAALKLVQVAYPLPRWVGPNGDPGAERLCDLIHSTVAPETWDVVGGAGCIRLVEVSGEPLLVISQTGDVHAAVERLLRAIHGRGLAEFEGGAPVLKVHEVADDRARADLERRLKDLCNATLGVDADEAAEVTAVAATLVVRSASPRFHALAAQLVAAVAEARRPPEPPPRVPMRDASGAR